LADLFRWPPLGREAWLATARQVSQLLAEVEAGRMDATPAEQVALRMFVATVEGMSGT
jgi:hypothetical protein